VPSSLSHTGQASITGVLGHPNQVGQFCANAMVLLVLLRLVDVITSCTGWCVCCQTF
jgi:hypothetical protein